MNNGTANIVPDCIQASRPVTWSSRASGLRLCLQVCCHLTRETRTPREQKLFIGAKFCSVYSSINTGDRWNWSSRGSRSVS